MSHPTTLFICRTCGMGRDASGKKLPSPASAQLAEDLQSLLAGHPVNVVLSPCLEVCDFPITWALRNDSKQAFTFAPSTSAADLAATTRAYLALAPGEKLTKGQMPETIPATIISRLPPIK
ncbi:MAG: DUF1636 domain-containing protein [Proteobacteria bacterium]|nr:DUF1636 domain-containing protein [Pseudomonadota bacterium]